MATARSHDNAKLARVLASFFTKAALTIISSRIDLPQSFFPNSNEVRSNRWYNLLLDETDILAADLAIWDSMDMTKSRPPPLFIEIYLDTAELSRNQTLAIMDDRGRRWDACEALSSPSNSHVRGKKQKPNAIVLERWRISFIDSSSEKSSETMPNFYKKAVLLFRSLYTYARFLPAWKFSRRIAKQPATLTSLRPLYRIVSDDPASQPKDLLKAPLYPSAESTTQQYRFNQVNSPVGPLDVQVCYRVNCDFLVDDSEALLSSHFAGMDDRHFRPSLVDQSSLDIPYTNQGKDIGSLPTDRSAFRDRRDTGQAYGSMSTFHQAVPGTGASPISALRAAREINSDSLGETPPSRLPPSHRSSQASKSSLRSIEGAPQFQRRVSVSFQPFKAGSLSSSPALGGMAPPSPGFSSSATGRTSTIGSDLAQARYRTSISALPQTALRIPQATNQEVAVASPISSSPKAPTLSRYSSSFGNRHKRFSSGGGSIKGEDDNNSSGKASLASSNQPGSGLLAEPEGNSSSSARSDDDNISDFLSLLESKKDLPSFNRTDEASRDASTRRTTAQLSRFQRMRESHTALTESMSLSMKPESGTPPSRKLSSVPPMLAGASVSTSSSPGKPISPHTPHTPAIPSRLSAHATISDQHQRPSRATQRPPSPDRYQTQTSSRAHTSAIDIPTSPHRYHARRSSSAAHHTRAIEDEFGLRSASMPLDDASHLSLSELVVEPGPVAAPAEPIDERRSTYRPRARGGASQRGSTSSVGTSSNELRRHARHGTEEDEPLLFTMSEVDAAAQAQGRGETMTREEGKRR